MHIYSSIVITNITNAHEQGKKKFNFKNYMGIPSGHNSSPGDDLVITNIDRVVTQISDLVVPKASHNAERRSWPKPITIIVKLWKY